MQCTHCTKWHALNINRICLFFVSGWNERIDRHNKIRPAWFTHRLYLRSGWVEKRWLSQGNFCNTRTTTCAFDSRCWKMQRVKKFSAPLQNFWTTFANPDSSQKCSFWREFFPDVEKRLSTDAFDCLGTKKVLF